MIKKKAEKITFVVCNKYLEPFDDPCFDWKRSSTLEVKQRTNGLYTCTQVLSLSGMI